MNQSFEDDDGGHDGYAQREITLTGDNLVQLRSCKTGDYLRIHDNCNRIDVGDKDSRFTFFRFDIQRKNVVKLQSNLSLLMGCNTKRSFCIVERGDLRRSDGNNNNNNNVGLGIGAVTGAVSAMMQQQPHRIKRLLLMNKVDELKNK